MMKGIILGFALAIFAILVGYLTFSLLGLDQVEPVGPEEVQINRLKEADSLVFYLVTSVGVAAILGSIAIVFILPKIAQKFADITYQQNLSHEPPPTKLDQGRSLILQGEPEQAIAVIREFIEETEIQDRMAWVEIAQLQLEEFEDPDLAIETLQEGWQLENANWQMDDDVNFITRLAELYRDQKNDRNSAVQMYKTILERYPENEFQTAQARAALRDLGVVA